MNNKLELTWVGKYDSHEIEPRILIYDENKSYGDKNSDNMLIHGDNLLALKALEKDYTNKIKCIYIDPPYNTGSAFEFYDDNLEHSIWLTLMKERLTILQKLLRDDGFIFVQIDDNEQAYLKVLMDEIFGRKNYINQIVWKRRGGSANPSNKLNNVTDYILWYSKTPNTPINQVYSKEDENTKKYISERFKFFDENGRQYMKSPIQSPNLRPNLIYEYKGYRVPNKGWSVSKDVMEQWDREGKLAFPDDKSKTINRKIYLDEYPGQPISSLWTDIFVINPMSSERTTFDGGQKPELLIKRILELTTKEGDLILDSFLGSGTTCATAHKMKRRWIGIEMGDHIFSHCIPRLNSIIDGTENAGITELVGWEKGGGYKFYELAPSLIEKDMFEQDIINTKYNDKMLSEAVALHEDFVYEPSDDYYWKQSKSNEHSFLYVTTNFIGEATIDNIKNEMKENEYLIIACTAFDEKIEKKYKNIRIKKIPEMLLNQYEYGVDNYNLNATNNIEEEYEDE